MEMETNKPDLFIQGEKESPSRIGSKTAAREEYALHQVPETWRYNWSSLIFSLLGGGTAAIFLALPAQLAGQFGIGNVLLGLFFAMIIQTLLNYPLVKQASETGLGAELLSRGLGFGFYGSAWSTLLYWISWLIFFGTEAQILGDAINAAFGIPQSISYVIVGAAFIPLVLYGISFISKFQKWTFYLYIVGLIALLWKAFTIPDFSATISDGISTFGTDLNWVAFLGVMGAYFGLIGNVTLGHSDIARLGATDKSLLKGNKMGPFWLSFIPYSFVAYMFLGALGILFWLVTKNDNPGSYFVEVLGTFGFLLIIITQLRINLVNAYSGSIALSNFFSRYRFLPGRSILAVSTVVLGTLLTFGNVLGNLSIVLTILGVLFMAWLGVILTDILINRKLFGFGPNNGKFIEYRRALVSNWNYAGLIPMFGSTIIGLILYFSGGEIVQNLATPLTFIISAIGTVLTGLKAKGTSYSKREPVKWQRDDIVVECPVEHEIVSTESMVPCPFHGKWISSQACMATKGCGEICTTTSHDSLAKIPLPERTSYLKEINEQLKQRNQH